jgi:hypothetical protein
VLTSTPLRETVAINSHSLESLFPRIQVDAANKISADICRQVDRRRILNALVYFCTNCLHPDAFLPVDLRRCGTIIGISLLYRFFQSPPSTVSAADERLKTPARNHPVYR